MNKVYFIRHAKTDYTEHNDLIRPLTESGIEESIKLIRLMKNKNITRIYSSPYKRSIDTVIKIAEDYNIEIELIEDFRERKITDSWIEDFDTFSKKQWDDFDFKIEGGESLTEVSKRNVDALTKILNKINNESIIIGTHGTALSTIIKYYDPKFNYESFMSIKDKMPFVVCMTFNGTSIESIKYIDRI